MGIVLLRPLKGAARLGAVAVGTVVVSAVAAFAYFTASGALSGPGSIGSSTAWSVTGTDGGGNPSASGLMYPGAAGATFAYRVTNTGSGHQGVEHVSVSFATATDSQGNTVVVDSATGSPVAGCLAGWFSVGPPSFSGATLPTDLAPGGYLAGSAQLVMADEGAAQDACGGTNPRVTVTAG